MSEEERVPEQPSREEITLRRLAHDVTMGRVSPFVLSGRQWRALKALANIKPEYERTLKKLEAMTEAARGHASYSEWLAKKRLLSDPPDLLEPLHVPRILWYPGSGIDLVPLISIYLQRVEAFHSEARLPPSTCLWMVDNALSAADIPDSANPGETILPYHEIWSRLGASYTVVSRDRIDALGWLQGEHHRVTVEMVLEEYSELGPLRLQTFYSEADAFSFVEFFRREEIVPYAVTIARGWREGFGTFGGERMVRELEAAGLQCPVLCGTEGALLEWSEPPTLP